MMRTKVLLVDDEPLVLETLNRSLRKAGYNLLGANSADEGMAILLQPLLGK